MFNEAYTLRDVDWQ